MAQVPFLFGALDTEGRKALNLGVESYATQQAGLGFLQRLEQAIAGDTAPMVDLPNVRGANLTQGLGAILQNIVDPGAAERFANQQAQVRQLNAQIDAQEALANQMQEGYLQRRKQGMEEKIAEIKARDAETRARINAQLTELGFQRDERKAREAAAVKAAALKQREEIDRYDREFVTSGLKDKFDMYADMLEEGAYITPGPAGNIVYVNRLGVPTEGNRPESISREDFNNIRAKMLDLITLLPEGSQLRDNLTRRIESLGFKEPPPPPPPTDSTVEPRRPRPGLDETVFNFFRGSNFQTLPAEPTEEDMFWTSVLQNNAAGLVDTGMPATVGQPAGEEAAQAFFGDFLGLPQAQRIALPQLRVNQAIQQETPTRR